MQIDTLVDEVRRQGRQRLLGPGTSQRVDDLQDA
jgi:hypothetical protein